MKKPVAHHLRFLVGMGLALALAPGQRALAANEVTGSCLGGGSCTPATASVSVFVAQAVPVRTVQLVGLPSFTFRPSPKATVAGGTTDQITSYNRGGTTGGQSEFCVQDSYASRVQVQVTSPNFYVSHSLPSWNASGVFVALSPGVDNLPLGVSIRPKGSTDLVGTSSQNSWTFDRTGSPDCSGNPSDASIVWVDVELLGVPQNNATYTASLAVVATPK